MRSIDECDETRDSLECPECEGRAWYVGHNTLTDGWECDACGSYFETPMAGKVNEWLRKQLDPATKS